MFIYSVRGTTVKLFGVIALALALLLIFTNLGGDAVLASVAGMEINYGGIDSNDKRVEFIEKMGVKVNPTAKIEESFPVPESFDRIIAGYNEIQKAQGLDLTEYHGKRVTHYAYEAVDYDYDGVVYVNLYIHKNRIVGCDVSSMDGAKFVKPLVGSEHKTK